MPLIARIGDQCAGVCDCWHPGTEWIPIPLTGQIVTGASNSSVEGPQAARVGDLVVGACGHTGIIVSGSPGSNVEGAQLARTGDVHAGCFSGVIITGAGNSNSG